MTGGCIVKGVVSGAIQGVKNCLAAGGTVNTPWGQRQVHWGMLTAVRDSNGSEINQVLGNGLPLWKVGWSHNVQFKRLNVYGLIDKTFGNKTYNESRHWSWGDFMTSDAQQNGKSVETAKPIGYYWRSAAPEAATGIGGTYDQLGPNNISYEDGGYVKLRELSLSYNVGSIKHVLGNWSVTAVGRNLYTWTKFTGWDPDAGAGRGVRTTRVGRTSLCADCLNLSANAELHVDALLQVLNLPLADLPARIPRARAGTPRPLGRKYEGDSHTGISVAACPDGLWCDQRLEVKNLTDPDIGRVFATGASIESTIGAGYQTIHNAMANTNNQPGVEVFGLESYSSLNNFNLGTRAAIPRLPINNVIGAPSIFSEFTALSKEARLVVNAMDALEALVKSGKTIGTTGKDLRARSFGFFVAGVSLGWMAMMYDSAAIVTTGMPSDSVPPLSGAADVMKAAIVLLDSALVIANTPAAAPGFPLEPIWMGNSTGISLDQYKRIIRSYQRTVSRRRYAHAGSGPRPWIGEGHRRRGETAFRRTSW
jgi:hypothetical protein